MSFVNWKGSKFSVLPASPCSCIVLPSSFFPHPSSILFFPFSLSPSPLQKDKLLGMNHVLNLKARCMPEPAVRTDTWSITSPAVTLVWEQRKGSGSCLGTVFIVYCCHLLLIYTTSGSKAKENMTSSPCLAAARVAKCHGVAFCHHADSWLPCATPHHNAVAPSLGNVLHYAENVHPAGFSNFFFFPPVKVKMENYTINRSCINSNEDAVWNMLFSCVNYIGKQSQNHLLLATTRFFFSFYCYFNLTTQTFHNHLISRIIRVHYWKRKHPGEKTNNKQTPWQSSLFHLSF